jgi:Mg-chelatase subunit ChlD/TolB-like protein
MLLKRRFLIAVLSTLTVTCAHDRARAPSGEEHAPLDEIRSLRSGGNDPLSEIRTESTEHEEAPRSSIVADEELPPSALAAAPAKPSVHAESRRARTPVYDLDKTGTRPSTAAKMRPAEAPAGSRAAPAAPALKAGRHDDNKEYNRFLAFLAQNEGFREYSTDINERLLVRALDRDGRSLPNCPVAVKSTSGKVLAQTTTYADGSTQFFPAAVDSPKDDSYVVQVKCGDRIRNGQLARAGRRDNEIRFDFARKVPTPMPVDVAIVLDTTGSMQGQIDRLKQTLKAIHFQLTSLPMHPDIRFGMVAYRDRGDSYLTRITQFTSNVESYQAMLENLYADGGGDTPEDLQSALDVAMHQLTWRRDALRIGFVITDAPPHTDYGQQYNYLAAMKESLSRGIKWVTVGAGGLGIDGEVIYRQIAQYSMGEYVFITQGGGGDSEGGTGEASHHVGGNYSTENLDQAIVRIVRRELSYLTDTPKDFDTTIVATGDKATPRDQILAPAVAEALRQLADYSSLKLGSKTLVAIVPVTSADKKYKSLAEYLTDQMILSASRNEFFKVVERDLAALSQEMKLQLSNLFDESATVPIGKMVGAQILIASKLVVKGGGAELFSKLVRVETGEVLSVAKVQVTGGAGFGS